MTARAGFRGSRLALAVALPLPPLAWYGAQQGVGTLVREQCSTAAGIGGAVGLLALVACALAIWLSVPVPRQARSSRGQTDAVLSKLVLVGSGIFALAITFQTLATLIVPSCAR